MIINLLFFLENKKVLNFTIKNKRYLRKCQSCCIYFSTFNVADLVISYACFYGKLILGYAIVHTQLPQTLAQPPPEFVLLFRGHRSKVPLTVALNSPIYRVIYFSLLTFDREQTRSSYKHHLKTIKKPHEKNTKLIAHHFPL
jgi:hypothetical protein